MLKNILKNAGSDTLKYFPVRFIPALTSLITVPVFTRLIDATDYGNFYLISSATSLAATIATAWITNAVVRFYWTYERQDRKDDYVSTSVWLTVGSITLVAAIIAIGTLVLRPYLSDGLVRLVPVGLASLAITYFLTVLLQVLRASNRATSFAVLSIAITLVGTAASLFFVYVMHMGSFGILLGTVIGNAIVLPAGMRAVSKVGAPSPGGFSQDIAHQFATFGFPLVPAAMSSWLLVLADRYVIEFTRSTAEVGMYSVAYGLGEKIMQLVTLPLITAMGPIVIHTFEKEGQRLAQQVQTQLTRYFSLLTFPLLFGLIAASRHFMEVFTGPQYRSAYPILGIVAAGSLAYGLVQIAGNGIALHKKSTITMTNTLAAALVNVGMNLLLVPRYGYIAAAYSTLASYVVLLLLTWLRSRPYMEWQIPWADLGRITVASVTMMLVIRVLFGRFDGSLLVLAGEVAVGILVYLIMIRIVGALREDELEYIRDIPPRMAAWLKRRLR